MIIPLRLEIIGAAAVLLAGSGALAWHEHNSRLVAEGIAVEKTRVADSVLKAVHPVEVRAETTLVHATKTVTRLVSRLDTLRDTVRLHLTDTVQVLRFITTADSVARACTDALGNCDRLRALLTQERDAYKVKADAAASIPNRSCVSVGATSGVVGAALGGIAGYVLKR